MHAYVKCMNYFVHCIHCCDAMFLFCLIINTSINKTIIKYGSKAAQVVNLESQMVEFILYVWSALGFSHSWYIFIYICLLLLFYNCHHV